jgi:hypothetical protein
MTHTRMLGHGATRPMRVPRWSFLGAQPHDLGDLLIGDRRFAAPTLAHLPQLGQAILAESLTPAAHRHRRHADLLSDPGVGLAIGSHQQRLRAQYLPVRRRLRPCQSFQGLTLTRCHRQGSCW